MQQQLEKIGVKLTIKNSPDILDANMTGFDFETLIFAWVGGPDPYTGNVIWHVDRRSRRSARSGWPRPASATTRARTTPR